tara:strand:+ start:499 stop:1386 length:888 start_codon:yes stop_codon:yes gene_type:complete
MSWMRKFSSARLNNNSPLNDTVPGKGDHEHPHTQGVETTDNPQGEILSDKVYGEKQVTFGNWEDVDGRQQRTVTTTQGYTQTGVTPGKTYAEAGVDAEEAKKYWEQNPEAYKRYQESKKRQLKGEDVTQRIETRDLPKPPPPPPVEEEFKPYRIQMTRGFKNSDTSRKGITHPQNQTFNIDTPEKEAAFKAKINKYEKMQDEQYRQLAPDHFGKTEKALNLAIKKNKERELQRKRVASEVINLNTGQKYNRATGMFEDTKDRNEAFAMNYGTPMKNLNTEGTFKNKDNKKYNSYE